MKTTQEDDFYFMDKALELAALAAVEDEVPVGAILVNQENEITAGAGNNCIRANDPTGHAEIRTLRAAGEIMHNYRLPKTTMYVTLEPCPMCAAAISNARIARLYYGAADPKSGGVAQGPRVFSHPQCHHAPEVYDGLDATKSEALLKTFFAGRR